MRHDESEDGITANEFALIITLLRIWSTHIINSENIHSISYKDGCTYQNRNATLQMHCLAYRFKNKRIYLLQNFSQKRHTQREAESIYSNIECKIIKNNRNVPADYVSICKSAGVKTLYSVEYINFNKY